MNTVGILAAFAAMLLVVEVLLVVVLCGAIVYFLRRGLIVGQQEAAPYIQQVTEQVQRVESLTAYYAHQIIRPQVETISTVRGLRRGLRALLKPPADAS